MNDKKLGQALSKLNSRTKLHSLLDFDERTNEARNTYLFEQNDLNEYMDCKKGCNLMSNQGHVLKSGGKFSAANKMPFSELFKA